MLFVASINALKFDLAAVPQRDGKKERCIRNFVAKDTLVVVTAIVSGSKGDGQVVNIHVRRRTRPDVGAWGAADLTPAILQIRDTVGNEYGRPRDVAGEQRTVFTSHADAAFDVCFENTLQGGKSSPIHALFGAEPTRDTQP